ncbi:Protein yellow [Habropoda laboriosa]|uniref:Protein yellow n=1 Tax=Habropoda laboriosa TaxID=597456 RepID=A0A0L7R056_9HYME|nr:PREDICTED: protein yellow-like [Habropoda laboriosa]KOC64207.1 Protein yellow [Habropoda laboriosa]
MRVILLIACLAVASCHEFKTIHSWNYVEFNFPNATIQNTLTANGEYVPENNMPLGVQVWEDKIFITVPRWKNGVASNLNYIAKDDPSRTPKLNPYPNFDTNYINTPDGIVSIFRVRIDDACGRLWGVDTGVNDILGNSTIVRPVRIIVIDLKTDKIIRIYPLKSTDQTSNSFFAESVVDSEPDNCDNSHLYISDLGGYGMVVYSWAKNDSWRITHNFFYFDPLSGNYNVSGYNFQWTDGLFGLALSLPRDDGYKTLYFHPMSSVTEFSVSTEVLQDSTLTKSSNYYAFHVEGDKGPFTQGPTSVIDIMTGINYFAQVLRNGIACWDTNHELNPSTFVLVAEDNTTLVFPNDLSIDRSTNMLYVLSDNLPQFLFSQYDMKKRNFFLTATSLESLSKICKRRNMNMQRRLPHIL